jgi:hypothetical protein
MGSKIAEAFRQIEGRHETLADLDLAMRKVRMEVFGVLTPETKIRDLYEIAQENGWITLDGDAYIVSVSIPDAKPKWHSCPHCAMSVTDGGRCGCPGEVIAERDQLRDELEARKQDSLSQSIPDDIRAAGWAVAVHNDYRLNGVAHTFWLFTKVDRCVKGEGLTDADALNQIRLTLGLFPGTRHE